MTECADRAAILGDIRQMPMGFETLVGDMGSTLSGGQKQRVILARALYRRPTILFLDEATSHLDEETEAVVARALRDLRITRVIVAHRPATIAHADTLIKLESFGRSPVAGRVAGEATQPSRFPGEEADAALAEVRAWASENGTPKRRMLATAGSRGKGSSSSATVSKPASQTTRDNQAETAVADAEVPQVVNIQAQERGLAEEATQRSSPAWKLKTSALASQRGGEAIQSPRLPGVERTIRDAAQPLGLGLRTSNETRDNQAEIAVVDAQVPRARNIQAQERGLVEEATQSSSRAGRLKTSALALAGAAIIGVVPTMVQPPSDETIPASSSAMQRSAESTHVKAVNSEQQMPEKPAKAGGARKAAQAAAESSEGAPAAPAAPPQQLADPLLGDTVPQAAAESPQTPPVPAAQ